MRYKTILAALALAIAFTLGCEEKESSKTAAADNPKPAEAEAPPPPKEEARGGFTGKHETFKDDRDRESYKWIKIGKQTWMAENLNYEAEGSKCYEDQESNCQKYGRLYNWETALSVCPKGWHLPSDAEWQTLLDFTGGGSGTVLRAKSGWDKESGEDGNGTDEYGFSALPGFGISGDNYHRIGDFGGWWSASNSGKFYAYYYDPEYNNNFINGFIFSNDKDYEFFSVRCVLDN